MNRIPRTGIRISIGLQVVAMLVLFAGVNYLFNLRMASAVNRWSTVVSSEPGAL